MFFFVLDVFCLLSFQLCILLFAYIFMFLCFLCMLCIPPSLLPIIVAHLPLLHLILHQHREDLSLDRLEHYRNYYNPCFWKTFIWGQEEESTSPSLDIITTVFFSFEILEKDLRPKKESTSLCSRMQSLIKKSPTPKWFLA